MKILEYLNEDEQEAVGLGLSTREAETRQREHGKNVLTERKKVHPFQIFICQFKDFLTMVLLAGTAISVFMGEYTEALTIAAIILLNGIMGFMQEYRTERTLEALKKMAAPQAKVYRDGSLTRLPGEELVPGDAVAVEAGDRVPADGVLLEAMALSADESVLTGESVPAEKRAATGEQPMMKLNCPELLYMGTTVTTGHGMMRLTATGMETQMGKIAGMIQEIPEEPTPLQKKLDELGKYVAIGCLIICGVVALAGFLRGEPIFDMLMTGVSLAVAAVPEGLPAIVTISLALAVGRMVKRQSLIRRLHAVETLGCADIICSDKTGTLTENRMTVQRLWVSGEEVTVELSKEKPFSMEGKLVNPAGNTAGQRLLESFLLCNNAVLQKNGKGGMGALGDPTEAALLVAADRARLSTGGEYTRVDEIPFDSTRKLMSVMVAHRSGERLLFCKGGCDVLLKKCSSIMMGERIQPLTVSLRRQVEEAAEGMAKRGLRVLGAAFRPLSAGESGGQAENAMVFTGLVGMMDPPRAEAKEAVQVCRRAGIKTVMITGDHKLTACAIAGQIGIFRNGDRVLTGDELDNMTDEELTRVAEETTVFARVSPRHKLKIVRSLKRRGHIVAMTGDGVNDAPAIKEADIGVSMGITGTDVTKEASDVILLDDNFATLVTAVEEGRTIYGNIRKFIRYLLSCNIGEVLTMFLGILMGMPVVLLPIHILMVNLVTDGLPAIALGLEPTDKDSMKKTPRRAEESIFSGGLLSTIIFRGCLIGLTTLGVFGNFYRTGDLALARSAAFLTLVMSQLIHVFECKSEDRTLFTVPFWNNFKLIGAVMLSSVMIFAAIYWPPMQAIFQTVPLNLRQLCEVGVFLAAAPLLAAFMQKLFKGHRRDTTTVKSSSARFLSGRISRGR